MCKALILEIIDWAAINSAFYKIYFSIFDHALLYGTFIIFVCIYTNLGGKALNENVCCHSGRGNLRKRVCGVWHSARFGDFQAIPISAKSGDGMDDLMNAIILESEVLELKANKDTKYGSQKQIKNVELTVVFNM